MLIKIDAAQLEFRVATWLSNDPIAIEEILSGKDIHSANQAHFNLPDRLTSKIYLFRTIFRGSGWSFANDPDFRHVSSDADYWDDVNEKFYKKYKGLDAWHKKLAQLVVARKPIVSPFGRIWMIPMRDDGNIPWTTLSNYPVQGSGADLMMIARLSLARRLAGLTKRTKMISTVHDDIKLDAPDDEVELVAKTAYEVFDDIPKNVKKIFGVTLPIPFPGEVSVGKNLKTMEKYPQC